MIAIIDLHYYVSKKVTSLILYFFH